MQQLGTTELIIVSAIAGVLFFWRLPQVMRSSEQGRRGGPTTDRRRNDDQWRMPSLEFVGWVIVWTCGAMLGGWLLIELAKMI